MHLVNFPLMAQKTARIDESWVELATCLATLVGTFVPVHMFVPFTDSFECLSAAAAVDVVAIHLALFVSRRRSVAAQSSLYFSTEL